MTPPTKTKRIWQRVDGVLLFDKSIGASSNAVLQSVRRLFSAAKAGHTGTLDPLASGLLPICFGEATKFSSGLLNADKVYEAGVRFGATTTTADSEGEILTQKPVTFTRADLDAALASFRGVISQIPPMYSALKRDGKPLYQLARKGILVEREARQIQIYELELLEFLGDSCRLRVSCSKGTYIRTLAEDIGNALGCGAHLYSLRRTSVSDFTVSEAINLSALESLSEAERQDALKPVDFLLKSLPAVNLEEDEARFFSHGNPVFPTLNQANNLLGRVRVYANDHFLGLGDIDETRKITAVRLVSEQR